MLEERETLQSAVGKLRYSRKRKVCSVAGNFRRTTTLVVTDGPDLIGRECRSIKICLKMRVALL